MNRKARRAARNEKRPAGALLGPAPESSAAVQATAALGKRLAQQGDFSGALAAMDEALRAEPNNIQLHMWRGRALNSLWRFDDAVRAFDQALRLGGPGATDPHLVNARLGVAIAQLRLVYDSEKDLLESRRRFAQALERACAHYANASAQELAGAAQALTAQTPFLLPFQGQEDRPLMTAYGDLIHRLMSAGLPQWSPPRAMPGRAPGERIRVGFASAHFKLHSVWKVPLSGWIRQLDRSKVEVFGYSLGSTRDAVTEEATRLCDRMVVGPMSLPAWAKQIAGDNLHVLVYPEIGMDRSTVQLAALRLAPIQCNSLAHPSTTGLPTIDFVLSGDRLDSLEGQEHYTETLVRLPNFGAYYEPMGSESVLDRDRKHFGLAEEGVLYWAGHQLATFLPQHDDLYARIAERVPGCQLVFIEARSESATATFRARMERAFSARGLRFSSRSVILPVMPPAEFAAVTRLMDVGLDTVGWSGCNTTLETLMCDVPVITLPGNATRARHAFAFLTMMGVPETIAESSDTYVEIAVRLGRDRALRRAISEKIASTKARCYRDRECVTALEEFFERCVAERARQGSAR
jgi:predicted O-linked N-acetylglucosamine transferase (SPINDLY family)